MGRWKGTIRRNVIWGLNWVIGISWGVWIRMKLFSFCVGLEGGDVAAARGLVDGRV